MDQVWDHGNVLSTMLGPAEVAHVSMVDRAHAARAMPLWQAIRCDALVKRWCTWEPFERSYLGLVEIATYCQHATNTSRSVAEFHEVWPARSWITANTLERLALKAEHDVLCNHRRALDCRTLRVGRNGKPTYRYLVAHVLRRIRLRYRREDAAWICYCMLGIEARATYPPCIAPYDNTSYELVVPGWN